MECTGLHRRLARHVGRGPTAGSGVERDFDQDTEAKKTPKGATAAKKAAGRAKTAKKKADRGGVTKKVAAKATGLVMDPPIICKSIDGYEDYTPLPGAAQTADEKLLVYIRPTGYQTEKVEKGYQSHLTADGEFAGAEKAILRQKKKLLEYKPIYETLERVIFLKQTVSLKGLTPGDYELTIILHDELGKGSDSDPGRQVQGDPAPDREGQGREEAAPPQ